MRTTIDIDDPVLRELKRLQKREGKSLGRLVSDLLAAALTQARSLTTGPVPFRWKSRAMEPRIDLADRDAVHDAMDGPSQQPPSGKGVRH